MECKSFYFHQKSPEGRVNRNWCLALSALSFAVPPALAQQARPDAGTLLERQQQLPALPAPGGAPTVVVPPAPPAAAFDRSIQLTPSSFRIQGNTLFSEAELQPVVAQYIGQPTNMEGLLAAAAAVRRFYRERGYLLTEAYLPQQQLSAQGGSVTIQVLEARVGKVSVRVDGEGVSESMARSIVDTHLHPGDHISEYSLDKPILLLRDLPGFDATASVAPGTAVGEADITVTVKPYGSRFDTSLGVDNHGVRSAGEYRAFANIAVNNLTTRGDQIALRLQATERSDTHLFRLGYSIPVTGYATKLGASVARNEYSLGKDFAALGATGRATVYDVSLTHPFIRSRTNNLLGAVTLERKDLVDRTETPPSDADKQIDLVRLSLLGNFVDSLAGSSFNSYAVNLAHGDLDLDPVSLAQDQGVRGLRTAGSFTKLNLEYLRTTYVTAASRLTAAVQAQLASKNLTSAEKLTLGGPTGVRGYPAGDTLGDTGVIVNLEYQHQLPRFFFDIPVSASAFYDWGHVKFNEAGSPVAGPNSETLSSVGLGLSFGTYGNYLLTTQFAWRTESAPASEDRKPRIWVTFQKWL
jgi:hemolysin activation/secretion protein